MQDGLLRHRGYVAQGLQGDGGTVAYASTQQHNVIGPPRDHLTAQKAYHDAPTD
jgi:hypothetical protein